MRKTDEVVLWPIYFDSSKPKSEGRKIPKKLGNLAPALGMIEKALQNLRLSYRTVPDVSYPRFPWKKTGYILVKKKKSKNQLLKDVASEISKIQV